MRRMILGVALLVSSLSLAAQAPSHFPHNIPDLCTNPTVTAVQSGAWSHASTWSSPPGPGARVSIPAGTTVTYDLMDATPACVGVHGTLRYLVTVSTRLTTKDLFVHPTGALEIGTMAAPVPPGVQAELVIADVPPDTSIDPEQYGTGLVVFGTLRMHGAVVTPTFTRLAVEPLAGASALTTSDTLAGWRPGDRLILPDTRHLRGTETGGGYQPQWEEPVVTAASGTQITLASPLAFDHPGARDMAGTLEFLPHVGNLTRNVIVRSQNPSGARGHVIAIHRADVDVRYARFQDLGRTTIAPLNNTTFDSSGNVTHIGTNQIGRYPVHFHHLFGPTTTPASGYQFVFAGNAIEGSLKWPLAIHNTHFGLTRDNVVYNGHGALVVTEDGSETGNVIEHNFAVRAFGTGGRQGGGREGTGFYFRGPNNHVRGNVAANIRSDIADSGYGFKYFFEYLGNIRVPNFPGADTTVVGEYTTVDSYTLPLTEFANNEVYGATESGLTYWWIGTFGSGFPRNAPTSTIKDFRAWHVYNKAIFHYPANNLVIDGFTVRGGVDPGQSACCAMGFEGADYYAKQLVLKNFDVQRMRVGINTPSQLDTADPLIRVENSRFGTTQAGILHRTLWTSAADATRLKPRRLELHNVRFPSGPQITMQYGTGGHQIHPDEVVVTSHDGVAGDDFQVYYLAQASDQIVPQTVVNSGGFTTRVGSPDAGLTNAENWAKYGIAIAGAITPCTTTRAGIVGYVCGAAPPPPPPPPPPQVDCSGLRLSVSTWPTWTDGRQTQNRWTPHGGTPGALSVTFFELPQRATIFDSATGCSFTLVR